MSKPFVLIELDRLRKLRYSSNALVLLEELLGRTTPELAVGLQTGRWGFRELRAMLYAGLWEEDKELDLIKVGNLMDLKDIGYVIGKISDAFNAAFPRTSEDTEKNVAAAAMPEGGIGGISSDSPPLAD